MELQDRLRKVNNRAFHPVQGVEASSPWSCVVSSLGQAAYRVCPSLNQNIAMTQAQKRNASLSSGLAAEEDERRALQVRPVPLNATLTVRNAVICTPPFWPFATLSYVE